MRALHLTVVALFAIATFIFAIQNLEIVTVSFLGLSATAPMAIVACIVYLLGMATGGSVFALLRWSLEGARQRGDRAVERGG
jgi:lipopolysaccharide assembly protein A